MERKKYKIFAILLLLILSVTLYLFNIDKNTIAKTQSYKISTEDVSDYIKVSKMQYDELFGRGEWKSISNTNKKKDELISNTIDNILITKIHTSINEKDNIDPGDEDIDKFIGKEDTGETRRLLKKYGISDKFFRSFIRDSMNDNIYKENYKKKNRLSNQEIKNYYLEHRKKYRDNFKNIKDKVASDLGDECYEKSEKYLLNKETKKVYKEKYKALYKDFE